MAFGYHLMLELYGCDLEKMKDFDICYSYLENIPNVLETNLQSSPFLIRTDGRRYPDKAGFSGWVPVVDSGISIHTLDPACFISIDIYTCKHLTKKIIEKIKEYTTECFKPKDIEEKFILRGTKYKVPEEIIKKRQIVDKKRLQN